MNNNTCLNASADSGYHCNPGEQPGSEAHSGDEALTNGANGCDSQYLSPAFSGEVDFFAVDARERLFSNQSLDGMTLKDMEDGNTLSTLYERLQQCINITLDISSELPIPYLLH